ncbi:uncharacterized protein LOC113340523 [Papaver somniferum]|uniref:uncharacterized protein LOC113340523 n=1 Tax=Papaver somniferum TaxID=3469 RepID=UPI000E701813|nr:uncharacterized protein LOC113340523 [Papaver somniferum]
MNSLHAIGGAYTWSNNQAEPLLCRLDRFLFSVDFDEAFPNALQIALTRTISDHNPIIIVTCPSIGSKPYFKLEKSWIEHKDFKDKVKLWWETMVFNGSASSIFFLNLQNLKYFIKKWRLLEFGAVRREKQLLTEKIGELNLLEENGPLHTDQFEVRMQSKLKLKALENLEARKWQLRAKQNGFKWGDASTGYFHRISSAKKKRNTIAKLQIGGEDSFNQDEIKEELRNFYINLFSAHTSTSIKLDSINFPVVYGVQKEWIERDFTDEEVWEVIRKMGCKQILDGVLIANECVDSRIKSKKPGVICKIDMEKAFDNVNWHTLFCILQRHGFGERWVSWIKWCVSQAHLSVLVNGVSTEKFKPSKGLRQGDSLSPFLLLLVVEIHSKLMNDAVERGQIHGFKIVDAGLMISHLQFADDTLLFVDADEDEVTRILIILTIFETLTGMKLNLEKSSMISVGADDNIHSLAKILGCKTEKLPIKYLGMPIGAHIRNTSVWDYVIERMEIRLASWKKRFLNKDVRLVLIKDCFPSLPIYYLSLYHLPASI